MLVANTFPTSIKPCAYFDTARACFAITSSWYGCLVATTTTNYLGNWSLFEQILAHQFGFFKSPTELLVPLWLLFLRVFLIRFRFNLLCLLLLLFLLGGNCGCFSDFFGHNCSWWCHLVLVSWLLVVVILHWIMVDAGVLLWVMLYIVSWVLDHHRDRDVLDWWCNCSIGIV